MVIHTLYHTFTAFSVQFVLAECRPALCAGLNIPYASHKRNVLTLYKPFIACKNTFLEAKPCLKLTSQNRRHHIRLFFCKQAARCGFLIHVKE